MNNTEQDSSPYRRSGRASGAWGAVSGVYGGARGMFYGWKLVGICVFMLALMSVAVFQGLGTFLVALERKFAWSRTSMSLAFSLARGESAVLGPIEGWLIDKLGNRRMIIIGYVVMAGGFIYFSRIEWLGSLGLLGWLDFALPALPFESVDETLIHFYIAFLIITLGSGLGGWLAMISMVNNWFVRKRSLAIATAMSGIHIGGYLVFALAYGVDNHGFEWTTLGIGVFLLAIIGPVSMAVRNKPEDMGLRPDGDRESLSRQSGNRQSARDGQAASGGDAADDEPEFTARQALRTRAFWALTLVHLSSSISIVTLSIHLAPKLTDMGFTLEQAALIPMVYTTVAFPAQFIAGFIADRMPKPMVTFVFLMFQATGILAIAFAESAPMAVLFGVLYGIGFGGRIPLLTAIRGEYFGRKAFATIMGLSQMPNNIAMIFAPLYAGYIYDRFDSYFVSFLTFAVLAYLGAGLMLTVRKPRLED